MPLKRCQRDNKKGWKFGDSGKCFTGPNAKQKALEQGRAIKSKSEFRRDVSTDPNLTLGEKIVFRLKEFSELLSK